MSTVLKNVLSFTGLVIGAPTALPHGLNINGLAVAPQLGGSSAVGFTITADATNVTVTRLAEASSGAVSVYVERWHSYESALPTNQLAGLTPFFFAGGGSGGGGEGVFDNFVFRPGGVDGGNVYTTWPPLVAATQLVQGFKTIQIDSSLAAATVPAGVWDMTGAELTGFFPGAAPSSAFPALTIADGASFTNLRKIGGDLNVTNANTTAAPVVIAPAAGGFAAIFELGAGSTGDYPSIINTGGAAFFDLTGLLINQTFLLRLQGAIGGTFPAIQLGASPGNFAVTLYDSARVGAGMIVGTDPGAQIRIFNVGSGGQVNRQAGFAGTITYGQPSTAASIGNVPWFRTWVLPASVNQLATVPSTAAFTTGTGLGMATTLKFNTTAGNIGQVLPLIRAAAPAAGSSASTPGSLEAMGLVVIIKNEVGANDVNVTPDTTNTPDDTIDGGAGPVVIPPGGARIFQSDGVSNWSIVGGYL